MQNAMAKAIGFRIEPKRVHYAVVEGRPEEPILLENDRIQAPKPYSQAEALSWYRKRVSVLLASFRPTFGAIKFMEPSARARASDNIRRRHRIEGVILQLLEENQLQLMSGAFTTIAAELGVDGSIKHYLERDDLRGINWEALPRLQKEAILVATAALRD